MPVGLPEISRATMNVKDGRAILWMGAESSFRIHIPEVAKLSGIYLKP